MKVEQQIQMHIDKAKELAAEAGLSLEQFLQPEGPEMEDSEEDGMEDAAEQGAPMGKPAMNKGKIALIVAKMKKAKGE